MCARAPCGGRAQKNLLRPLGLAQPGASARPKSKTKLESRPTHRSASSCARVLRAAAARKNGLRELGLALGAQPGASVRPDIENETRIRTNTSLRVFMREGAADSAACHVHHVARLARFAACVKCAWHVCGAHVHACVHECVGGRPALRMLEFWGRGRMRIMLDSWCLHHDARLRRCLDRWNLRPCRSPSNWLLGLVV